MRRDGTGCGKLDLLETALVAGGTGLNPCSAVPAPSGVTPARPRERQGSGSAPPPPRTGGGYWSYRPGQLARLSFTRRARDLGFSLEPVRILLGLADQRERFCEAVDAVAREHMAELDRKLADLGALRRELASLIGQCGHGTIAECRILEALAPIQDLLEAPIPKAGQRTR
ncbi:MerR family DNA-binding protein [Muricoccus pecuniae]|uniref:DNA-binding transcriptional MerR regulator n=1 Tax=Muricoccus pecuniae TaxID=693023 RepID=A0A840YIF5_9PROT|nr:MerR family DNA-binding protein [Roseomonas pecuniae]MBB5693833.1 DNA-binding transcriptional MerR regulator [Roseomonas pecuniae]